VTALESAATRPESGLSQLLREPEIASGGKRRSYAYSASEQAIYRLSLCKGDSGLPGFPTEQGINREVSPRLPLCQQSCSDRNLGGFEDRRLTQHELLDAIGRAIPTPIRGRPTRFLSMRAPLTDARAELTPRS
jgi:hypothetical protein